MTASAQYARCQQTFTITETLGRTVKMFNEENRDRRNSVILLNDGSVAHLVQPNHRASVFVVRQAMEILSLMQSTPWVPRLIGPIHQDESFIGYRRTFVPDVDPFWQKYHPRLTVEELLHQGACIAFALHSFHRRTGYILKDIKPANIGFSPMRGYRTPMFFDFDLVTPIGIAESSISGTPAFMTSEQVENDELSERTDVAGLALTLMSIAGCVHGYKVPGENLASTLGRARAGIFPYEELVRPLLPDVVWDLLSKACSKNPSERPRNAYVFGRALLLTLRNLPHAQRRWRLRRRSQSEKRLLRTASKHPLNRHLVPRLTKR